MQRLLLLVLPLVCLCAQQGLPPLVDRELFFGNPEIAGAQLSPDGKYVAFVKPWKDTLNVWVKKTEEPFSAARLLTIETKRPIAGYFWTRDAKYILFVKDNAGDENYNIHAVDPAATPASGADAPASRDLTGLKGVRIAIFDLPKTDPDIAYIGLNDRDKAWHDLYKLKLSTGERTLVRKNTDRIAGWSFDLKGQLRLATRVADNGDQEILRVDPNGFTKVYSCDVLEHCAPLRFQKDGKRVYLQTNKGADVDLAELDLFDPQTGKVEKLESDPLKRVDFGAALFSEVTDDIILTRYTDERTRRYFKDPKFEADYKWLQQKLPGREVGLGSHTKDEQMWLVTASGDTEPGETYVFDRKNRTLVKQYRIWDKLPRESARTHAAGPLQIIGWPGDSGLFDVAQGPTVDGAAGYRCAAWWAVGAGHVGLQSDRAVPGQSRLCGFDAEFPRVRGLRQKVFERRQR